MNKNLFSIGLIGLICVCLASIGVTSCVADYETEFTVESLIVPDASLAPITFKIEGGNKEVMVETNVPIENWRATSNADWCRIDKQKDKVIISAGNNDQFTNRIALITISYGHQSYEIPVTQLGQESYLLIEDKGEGTVKEIAAVEKSFSIAVKTNLKLDHVLIPDTVPWLHVASVQDIENSTEKIVTFSVDPNMGSTPRYGRVMLQSSQNYIHTPTFTVIQKEKYAVKLVELKESMLSSNALEPKEGPIKNLIDNNPGTYFHSAWSYSISEAHYIQIDLGMLIMGCKFWYQNRNNNNGKPTDVTIFISDDGTNWSELTHISSGLPTGAASQYESEDYIAPSSFRYFRFTVNKTNGGNAPTYFNMAEFKLYELYDL